MGSLFFCVDARQLAQGPGDLPYGFDITGAADDKVVLSEGVAVLPF
ncbi:MAG TPA: hypothetical protein VLA72_08525 [Anaerolineales bacterium]|nr:hypothetical protein [Anaerolineales bacterium]